MSREAVRGEANAGELLDAKLAYQAGEMFVCRVAGTYNGKYYENEEVVSREAFDGLMAQKLLAGRYFVPKSTHDASVRQQKERSFKDEVIIPAKNKFDRARTAEAKAIAREAHAGEVHKHAKHELRGASKLREQAEAEYTEALAEFERYMGNGSVSA